MNTIIEIMQKNKGYSRMKELREAGVQTRDVAKAVENGVIIKIKSGLYKLVNYPWDEHGSFADVCNSNKKAIICLLSAATYYELTTFSPSEIYVTVPHNTDKFVLKYPPIKVYYFIDKYYKPGIETINTPSGKIKIYDREKTIVDLFRYINKLGEDTTIESLQTYMRNRKKIKIIKLFEYAEICRVDKKIEPFIKAML